MCMQITVSLCNAVATSNSYSAMHASAENDQDIAEKMRYEDGVICKVAADLKDVRAGCIREGPRGEKQPNNDNIQH